VSSVDGRPERVALFVTCLVDLLHPEVGESTVALLREAGVDVDFPQSQVCCGQPPFNSGFVEDARRMGRTLLDAFEDAQAVVSPSGSCAAMVRSHYPHLFEGTTDHERAAALASKTYEL
jgi:L-lactate dehydrogenase complex protein LldE